MNLFDRLRTIDRRIIFVLIALSVFIPILVPMKIKIQVSPPARNLYHAIDQLPPGSNVLMAL